MMRRILQNSNGHPLTSRQILVTDGYTCAACSKGKLIIRPSFTKVIFYKGIFVGIFTHLMDLFVILWF